MKKLVLAAVTAATLLSGCATNQDKPDAWICTLIGGGVGFGVGDSVAPGTGLVGAIIGGHLCTNAEETAAEPVAVKGADGDGDGDGIADALDQCPNTPAGAAVDSNGCAEDSDGDGIADYLDKCPATPTEYLVNDSGCTQYMEQQISKELIINFDNNKSVVKEQFLGEVEAIADFLRKYPQVDLVIEGHTSKLGSAAYNQQLSEQRAAAVAELLVGRFGIAASRVNTVGYGESRLLTDVDTKAAHERNRRIVAVMSASERVAVKR